MSRLVPHPLLSLLLLLMWLVLTGFSLGHVVLGGGISLVAGWAMSALQPQDTRLRNWRLIPRLFWILFVDIIRSNIAVTRLIVTEGRNNRKAAFLEIPLKLTNQSALALLAIILTATPGTAWVEYVSETGCLTLHIFDAAEADHYVRMIRRTYEPLLQEIFE